jgi:asparagine synthase (glutamine-hydrolysing)
MLEKNSYKSGKIKFFSILDKLEYIHRKSNDLKKAFYFERIGFLSHNLLVTDKACMLQSIESRVPFLDNSYLNYAETMVQSNRINKIFDKKIINDILRSKNLKFIISRKKEGFNLNLVNLVSTKNRNDYSTFFSCEIFNNYISKAYIDNILKDHFEKKIDRSYRIWQLVFFKSWLTKFI